MDWRGLFFVFASVLTVSHGLRAKVSFPHELWRDPKISLICTTCTVGMDRILQAQNATEVTNAAIQLCIDLNLGNDVVCEGLVYAYEPEILYIHENAQDVSGKDICGILLGGEGCKTENPDRIWEVPLPDTPKPLVDETPLAGPGKPTLTILHLADTHFDPRYYPGADTAHCLEEYLCCREENGIASNPDDGAGFWGDYRNCDSPRWTLEALYNNINENFPNIDLIIWTGDLVPHDVWATTRNSNLADINEMADLVSQYFPTTPVFPAVGNHESSPPNLFPQPYVTDPEFDVSWLYDELNTIWQRWLPADVASSVAYGAFYSTPIRPGLRMVSLNTMYCYSLNFWLILDSTDIGKELEKLANELQDAEDKGDFVYIIGHIPAGNSDCTLTWSHEFNRIVSRYESTISGIFYGHTHKDHYQLYFDPTNSSRVYEIAYIAQSQTTYSKLNPGYKIYTVEGDFAGSRYRVLNHENWIMELNTSNSMNETVFTQLYSAKEDYNLPDLSPQSWLDFVYVMNEPNSTYFDQFYRNHYKAGPASLEECNENCKSNMLCRLLMSDNSDDSHCDSLKNYQ